MKSWGIRGRLIFVAALPGTLIAFVLAAYFLVLRYADVESELAGRGHSLITLLTPAAEYGVFSGNREELQHLAATVSRAPGVKAVAIYDSSGVTLAQVGDLLSAPDPLRLDDGWSERSADGTLQTFHAKIRRTALPINDPLSWPGDSSLDTDATGSIILVLSRAGVLERKQEMMFVTLAVTLATLSLAVLLALRLSADVSEPILALQRVVEDIRGGHLEARAHRHPATTLRSLEDGINDMAAALQAGRDQLENRIARATAELAQKKDEAEQASLAKSRFLAAASHDLRQPLHALVLFSAELVSRSGRTSLQRLAGQINAAIASLGDLLDGLLDFSRVDLGAEKTGLHPVDLDDLLFRVAAAHRSSAQAKGLQLRHHPTRYCGLSDPHLLYRMLSNLVANAVRYTERGGIVIGVRRAADMVRIEVWDTGIGIAEADRPLVFQEFFQTANPERNPVKGLGLGLSLVDRLSRLLDHPISLRSIPGRGSVFGITLPSCLPSDEDPAAPPGTLGSFDASVLIVSERDELCASLRDQLADWGCRPACVRSASEALEQAGNRPDLVLFEGRGSQALELLEALAGSGPPPALILIGDPGVFSTESRFSSRVARLAVPVRLAKLRALMHHLLDKTPSGQMESAPNIQ